MMLRHLLVYLQKLDGMPSWILDIGVFFLELPHDDVNLVFNLVFIHHGVFFMVIVHM